MVHSVWASGTDWRGGGYAVLAEDYARLGPVCVCALNRAGYGAERFTGVRVGTPSRSASAAPRSSRRASRRRSPGTRTSTGSRGRATSPASPPHYTALMRYHWVDDATPKSREA
ncbi:MULTISPECIES: hypothetical protein [unclassified Streptomyces]|uniref:hypothetical protein n=1 Tax=unclassified Streptomyces TaxID=2593676 RepID=UPI00114CD379|nr:MULTISPECIES: hypothetical protein [unclassified Streptomyces]